MDDADHFIRQQSPSSGVSTSFGYDVLQKAKATKLRQTAIDLRAAPPANDAEAIRNLITTAKAVLPHNCFSAWWEYEFGTDASSVRKYMSSARGKTKPVPHSPEHTTPPPATATRVPLGSIILDVELQPRASLDQSVLDNYVQLLIDGVKFPPVTVFRNNETLLLADGFHRWHAHRHLNLDAIDIVQIDGPYLDALRYSLSANDKHGLQRSAKDYTRGYEIACRHKLVDPSDSEAVAGLLHCSGSWADKLTAPARTSAKAERDAEIIRLKDEGKTHREVAEAVGVAPRTVTTVQRQHNAEPAQDRPVFPSDAAVAETVDVSVIQGGGEPIKRTPSAIFGENHQARAREREGGRLTRLWPLVERVIEALGADLLHQMLLALDSQQDQSVFIDLLWSGVAPDGDE